MNSISVGRTRRNGWLATSFGCCAPKSLHREEELDALQSSSNVGIDSSVCYEQPRPLILPRMQTYPKPSASRATSRFNDNRPWTSQNNGRPFIGAPTNFRKVDGSTPLNSNPPTPPTLPVQPVRRRRSFRPLELSIYLPENKLSPLPDFSACEWSQKPAALAFPPQAVVKKRNDSVCSQNSNFQIQRKPVPSFVPFGDEDLDNNDIVTPPTPTLDRSSMISSPRPTLKRDSMASISRPVLDRANTMPSSPSVSGSRVPPAPTPARNRSNTEPPNLLQRDRSRRATRDSIDDAIRELNTIVEERRAAANSAKTSARSSPNAHHVPAIAPNYKMHVRSETLSDIGSAFSMPLTCKPLPSVPSSPIPEHVGGSSNDLFNSFPAPPPRTPRSLRSTRSRLTGWLRRTNTPRQQSNPGSPFYKCQPPVRSGTATSSTPSLLSTSSTASAASATASLPSLPDTLTTSLAPNSPPHSPSFASPDASSAFYTARENFTSSRVALTISPAAAAAVGVHGSPYAGLGIRESAAGLACSTEKRASGIRIAVVPPTPPAYAEFDPVRVAALRKRRERLGEVGMAF